MDLQNINFSDKKVQQITLIILFGILVSGAIYWFMIKDNRVELENAIVLRESKQQELNKILNLKPQLEQLRETVRILRVELAEYEAVFPDSANTPILMSSITKMIRDNDLSISSFTILGANNQPYYIQHNYQLEIVGPYHKIALFFERLAQFELIVNVSELDLKVNGTMNQEISEYGALQIDDKYDDRINSIAAKFKISTYSSIRTDGVGE